MEEQRMESNVDLPAQEKQSRLSKDPQNESAKRPLGEESGGTETMPSPVAKKYRIVKPQTATGTSNRPIDSKSECPPHLIRSRDYLFGGLNRDTRNSIRMDTVASFSVTESQTADMMTKKISEYLTKIERPVIFDGMACVGGNTISFSKSFPSVLSNEFDQERYQMLMHNVRDVLKCDNVIFFNDSILNLAFTQEYDALFLDPEWGGPDYKYKRALRLTISDHPVEDFCMNVFEKCGRVSVIALKLPVNYDNEYLQHVAESHGYRYSFFSNYRKMTLTILERIAVA
jgi:hypothetical protein